MMTNRTKAKIDENLSLICKTLGLDQTSPEPENQRKILCLYNALRWTAEDVEEQCSAAAAQALLNAACAPGSL